MKTKEDFIYFYNNILKDIVKDSFDLYHNDYINKKNKVVFEQSILLIFIFITIFLLIKEIYDKYILLLLLAVFSLLFIFLLIINLRSLKMKRKSCYYLVNRTIYQSILEFISNNDFVYESNTQLAYEDFMKMSLFNLNLLNYVGSNFTASHLNDKRFVFCDATLYDLKERIKTSSYFDSQENIEYIYNYHYNEKIDIFSGLYYETTMKRKNNQYIYLIPNNINDLFVRKNLQYYLSFHGDRVKLENLKFEEKYNVYSIDELKSRYILSVTLMEKINILDKKIPNKKYFVFKSDGRLGIFIDGLSIENLLNQKFDIHKMPSQKYLVDYFIKINNLFWISSIFDEE